MIIGVVATFLTLTLVTILLILKDAEAKNERKNLLASAEVERANWMHERRELLNRIQRPEIVQGAPVGDFPTPELEQDDIGLVGSIRHDPDYVYDGGLADALTQAAFGE